MTTGNVDTFDSGLLKWLFSALIKGRDTTKNKSYYQYLTSFRFRHDESDYEYAEAVLFETRAALGIGRGGTTSLRVVGSSVARRSPKRDCLCDSRIGSRSDCVEKPLPWLNKILGIGKERGARTCKR